MFFPYVGQHVGQSLPHVLRHAGQHVGQNLLEKEALKEELWDGPKEEVLLQDIGGEDYAF